MMSFKGILKYLIYIFIAGWMFLLGIVVGRGTSPVTFDTRKFQQRLEMIADKQNKEIQPASRKMDLEFFDALDHPIPVEGSKRSKKTQELVPKKESRPPESEAAIPVKISLKKQTYKKQSRKSEPVAVKKVSEAGRYTLQIAAYKNANDAAAHMAALEKNGYAPYRVQTRLNKETWYRIRLGSYDTYDSAKAVKEKLKKDRIQAMIVKKDSHEDIKR